MSDDIDIGEISEALNDKADRDLNNITIPLSDYVIETQNPTSENNYTWYRLYKSGWVEQGGISGSIPSAGGATINLPKEMRDTGYSVFLTNTNYSSGEAAGIGNKLTSYFTIDYKSASITGSVYWQVIGFSAE